MLGNLVPYIHMHRFSGGKHSKHSKPKHRGFAYIENNMWPEVQLQAQKHTCAHTLAQTLVVVVLG